MKLIKYIVNITLINCLILVSQAYAEKNSGVFKEEITLIIYANKLAQVRESKQLSVEKGVLKIHGLSTKIIPGTILFDLPDGYYVNSTSIKTKPLTSKLLLQSLVGTEIEIGFTNPIIDGKHIIKARLISPDGIFEVGGKIILGQPSHYILKKTAAQLTDGTSLLAYIKPTNNELLRLNGGLSYLTLGLNWKPHYVADLTNKSLELSSWANISNTASTQYKKVNLRLAAGDLALPSRSQFNDSYGGYRRGYGLGDGSDDFDMNFGVKKTKATPQGDFYVYNIPGLVDLNFNQTQQIAILPPTTLKAKKQYILVGSRLSKKTLHPTIQITLKNTTGVPLPTGPVWLYEQDESGRRFFSGGTTFPQTPVKGAIKLILGRAFDLTAKQTLIERTDLGPLSYQATYRISLKNSSLRSAIIEVSENINSPWQILKENHQHKKISASMITWPIKISPQKTVDLIYTIWIGAKSERWMGY